MPEERLRIAVSAGARGNPQHPQRHGGQAVIDDPIRARTGERRPAILQPPRSAGPQSHESRRLQPPPPPPHLPLRARAAADTTITTQGHQTTTPPGYAASSTAPSLRSHGAQNTVAGPHSFQWPPSQAAIWHSRVQKCAASHTAQSRRRRSAGPPRTTRPHQEHGGRAKRNLSV